MAYIHGHKLLTSGWHPRKTMLTAEDLPRLVKAPAPSGEVLQARLWLGCFAYSTKGSWHPLSHFAQLCGVCGEALLTALLDVAPDDQPWPCSLRSDGTVMLFLALVRGGQLARAKVRFAKRLAACTTEVRG